MCDMRIVMNGEKLILLIRCTTDGAAIIALDLNDIHMSIEQILLAQCTIKE